jgi:hypothetical protein
MNALKSIFILSLFVFGQLSLAMQLPTQKKEITPTLGGLPLDLKKYLMPFVASGFPAFAARGMVNFAGINKEFNGIANDETRMLALLQDYHQRAPYTAHVVDLGDRLKAKPKTLPVMRKKEGPLKDMLVILRNQLRDGSNLYSAARENNVSNLCQLLKKNNIDLNWNGSYFGETALRAAANDGKIQACGLILQAGANPDTLGWNNDCVFLRMFLEFGGNPNLSVNGALYLICATVTGHRKIIKMLLKAGANPDFKGNTEKTARDCAWENRNLGLGYAEIFNILNRASYEKKLKNAKTALAQIDQSERQ